MDIVWALARSAKKSNLSWSKGCSEELVSTTWINYISFPQLYRTTH